MPGAGKTSNAYRCYAPAVAMGHVFGQAYEQLPFGSEIRDVNRHLLSRFKPDECTKILSERAKETIRELLGDPNYDAPANCEESALMAPSEDPDEYSNWCTLCIDRQKILILCAGCRVGVCSGGEGSKLGCVEWTPEVDKDDFVYYCPYCTNRKRERVVLKVRKERLPPWDITLLRADSPVLIIAATLPEDNNGFSQLLHSRLTLAYRGHVDLIMRLEVDLKVVKEPVAFNGKGVMIENGAKEAVKFLNHFDHAKLVIAIDSHCGDNGFLVWKTEDNGEYQTCSLKEILEQCIPAAIYNSIISPTSKPHNHKIIILNLSCGPSVTCGDARESLMEGHCADAVLSFANATTVVDSIADTLCQFVLRWARSRSHYDIIFAATVNAEWARSHLPVLSRGKEHKLYTGFSIIEPKGQKVICHRGCNVGYMDHFHLDTRDTGVRVTCLECHSKCTSFKAEKDRREVLGRRDLVKTDFPQPQQWLQTNWERPAKVVPAPLPTQSCDSLPTRISDPLPARALRRVKTLPLNTRQHLTPVSTSQPVRPPPATMSRSPAMTTHSPSFPEQPTNRSKRPRSDTGEGLPPNPSPASLEPPIPSSTPLPVPSSSLPDSQASSSTSGSRASSVASNQLPTRDPSLKIRLPARPINSIKSGKYPTMQLAGAKRLKK